MVHQLVDGGHEVVLRLEPGLSRHVHVVLRDLAQVVPMDAVEEVDGVGAARRLAAALMEAATKSTSSPGRGLMSSDNTHPSSAGLHIPDIAPDADNITAALTLAKAGWYLLPVKRGTKNPGSVVGKGWQSKSSREPDQIVAWFAGTDHIIAVHCGRSGALTFDVDHPDRLPDMLAPH